MTTKGLTQLQAVYGALLDGQWHTLAELKLAVGSGTESAISARIRDLRKTKFGSHDIKCRQRQYAPRGIKEYRLTPADVPVPPSTRFY